MRIMKAVLFIVLLQTILGGALAAARQEAKARRGARNSDDYAGLPEERHSRDVERLAGNGRWPQL
jgi:hypothetical protein